MKPARKKAAGAPPMKFTTAGGRVVSAEELLRAARSRQAATDPAAQPMEAVQDGLVALVGEPVALAPRHVEAVFDALVVGGCARGKTWVMNFLKASNHRHDRGALLTLQEVTQVLHELAAAGRVRNDEGHGYVVPAELAGPRLPALLEGENAGLFWRWCLWAGSPGSRSPDGPPTWAQFRGRDDMVAVVRLLMYSGATLNDYNRWMDGPLRAAASLDVMLRALTQPLMPALLDRMDSRLRLGLINALLPVGGDVAAASTLDDWIDAWLSRALQEVPEPLRCRIAERRMHALDLPGMHAALAGVAASPIAAMADVFASADAAVKGRWAEATAAFSAAYKALQAATRARRGVAPMGVTWIYPMALLAQPDPAAWLTARKFCIAESGSRKPSPYETWGLWAHAAGVRLGDEPLEPGAFSLHPNALAHASPGIAVAAAHRLLLSVWLGISPAGWTPAAVAWLIDRLVSARRYWLAKLAHRAGCRMGLDLAPLDLPGTPEPAHFFGDEREAWRDALAAITALGERAPSGQATADKTTTLIWQLQIDAEGRVEEVTPFERTLGARGWSKPKPISLAKVKKNARLDPRDAAVARCIETERYGTALVMEPVAAALALAHHPAVTFADAPEQTIELVEALPELEVSRRSDAGSDSFVFRIDPPLLPRTDPKRGHRFLRDSLEAEVERCNSLRVVRDAPDRARLIRVTPAQRRVAELVAKDWSVPVEAKAELEAALRVLSGHFQLHSDAAAGQEVPGESRLRAQLSPQGDVLHLRLVVMPFGAFGPAVTPGIGRERVMTMHEGLSLTTRRALADEQSHWREVMDALPFLDDGTAPDAGWTLDDPEQALRAVEVLPGLPAVAALDWPRGRPLRVTAVDSAALGVQVASGRDWFALQGELRVDEQRVLGLQRLMELANASRSRFIALGEGEYLALGERLRQQLADLQAAGRAEKGGFKLPAAAAAWLDGALEGTDASGDRAWQRRVAALAEAAALEPAIEGLQAELRTYQAEGFAWMVRLAHAGLGACLADDMGLGKTVQTLALLLRRAADGPALVLAPTSVCANWAAEAGKFAPALKARLYGELDDAGREALVNGAGPYDVVVASYALAHGDSARFGARPWTTLVLDEAQALKNAATQRARAVAGLDAGFRLALTGTPVENHLGDLWSIMNLVNPGVLGTAHQFAERFAAPIEKQRDGGARQRLRRLVSPFLLRRTKAQVLQDLPPRTEIVHRIEPSEQERAFLESLRRSASERVEALSQQAGDAASSFHVLAELTRLRRAACDPRLVAPELGIVGAKVQEFEQIVRELVDGQHKALVFSQFTDFLKLLAERLQGCGIAHQYLDGSTPAAERTRRVQAFQRGEGELFLISLKAGGFGLNLTAADYVLIVDPWWNPAAEDQAMGRAHRIGQQRPVTVYRLVTAGSIEERIVELHQDKRSLADGILEGQGDATALNAQALRELLTFVPSPPGRG